LNVSECFHKNCSIIKNGGAVYIYNVQSSTLENCFFRDCHCESMGGFLPFFFFFVLFFLKFFLYRCYLLSRFTFFSTLYC
jgi:hypothetical protein